MFGRIKNTKYQPVLIAAVCLCILLFVILKYTAFTDEKKEKDIRSSLLELLVSKKSQLEKALFSRIFYTKGVAAYFSINTDISNQRFYQLAKELIQNDSIISSMSVAKNCVITAIYPDKGHESAIGLDLLAHPLRRKIVERTIQTRKTFIAGPVELIEGGVAFISYTPIFVKNNFDSSAFWGVTDIVILKDRLFNEIHLFPDDGTFKFALKGVDGTGINGDCFFGDETIFTQNPVMVEIVLPTGNWTFAAVPIAGWEAYSNNNLILTVILYGSALIISILFGLLAHAMFKIHASERELKALFRAMSNLVIVFNRKGLYTRIAPTNEDLLVLPRERLLGKTLHEIFDKAVADFFYGALMECFKTKKTVSIDYPLRIDSEDLWFRARISYISENEVIYVAFDDTQKKIAEEHLKQSEQKLGRLNAMKDKLFSIIAHDLRSPFQSFLGLSSLLAEKGESLSMEERTRFAGELNTSLQKQYDLLTDLLYWSLLQTESFKVKSEAFVLYDLTARIFEPFTLTASLKKIALQNHVPADSLVFADANLIKLVLRNLVSNSIKFTNEGGSVTVSAVRCDTSIEISVRDTGIGIPPETVDRILNNHLHFTSKGTAKEAGTGLGLLLCDEIVRKHGGILEISSEPGKGSCFTFSLPCVEAESNFP